MCSLSVSMKDPLGEGRRHLVQFPTLENVLCMTETKLLFRNVLHRYSLVFN